MSEVYGGTKRKDRKARNKQILLTNLRKYNSCLVIGVDNVGSKQIQQTRLALRKLDSVIVMGKNTLMRKVIREEAEEANRPELLALADLMVGNVGLLFSNGNLADLRSMVLENTVPAAAKAGAVAPLQVIVPAGSTGMDPGQTGFFQTLNIATKIARGAIEIIQDVVLLNPGDVVTASHVALLAKMNMKPFFYGITVPYVYENGFVYAGDILGLAQEDLVNKFLSGARYVAAIGLVIGQPSLATVGHSLRNAFRQLVAITTQTEITFAQAEEYLAGGSSSGAASTEAPKEEAAPAPVESSESSSDAGSDFF